MYLKITHLQYTLCSHRLKKLYTQHTGITWQLKISDRLEGKN